MIRGRVNSQEEPEVSISLLVDGKHLKQKAIIDTGFNGYLSVPLSLVKDWYFFGYEKYEIATGDIVEQKVYLGKIIWNQKIQDVYVVASHAKDILIGTKLLRSNKLIVDFPKRKVVIR
jgi:clan AA aspartic protease